jgi:SAM-dependent methyltransferase
MDSMSPTTAEYLLAGTPAEVERLQLQARTWEPEAETMLNEIGVERGWRCIDVGCGPIGIVGPLARRTGRTGLVVGLDKDPVQLKAAREYAESEAFGNVEFREGDLFTVDLPAGSFDLVHARFVLAPVGRDQEVLERLTYLVREDGLIALQEPDAITWTCEPLSPSWECLKRAVLRVFEGRGGDFNAGVRLGSLLRHRGLQPVSVRKATLTLPGRHPYSRLLVQLAHSLRPKILSQGLLRESEFQNAMRICEEALDSPYAFTQTFQLVQAWGRAVRQPPRTMV